MSLSLLLRKFTVSVSLVMALPAVMVGQSSYTTNGGEYQIAGALPGNQGQPGVSINSSGGYVVWQDQNTFGNRLTIMARPLDSSLNASNLVSFRVNSSAKGDHENPHVALLKNGGAVFVWQGGQFGGFQHIYARFLSASNTWLALDQMVNASAKVYQANPAVAVLNDGNVVIVYASYNTNTMQDVYGQMFSPTGQKLGNEIQLNQFPTFNQRSPAVAALTNGGFVTAWVSEQQPRNGGLTGSTTTNQTDEAGAQIRRPYVDVYARLFDASGTAAGSEFLVNDTANVCANPAVAAAADGTVMFAWSERISWGEEDAVVLNDALRKNGWDVFARRATFSGGIHLLGGVEQRLNTQLYGDQFAPHLIAGGTNFLAVWTSMGQDGSGKGIFGQFLNLDGSHAGEEFRVNGRTAGAQELPALAVDGSHRFLAVWTGPTFGPSKSDLFAQIYSNGDDLAAVLMTNYFSPQFVGDTSSGGVAPGVPIVVTPHYDLPTIGYPGSLATGGSAGNIQPNAFALAAGSYKGLFYEVAGVSSASSGYFTATTTKAGSYTAKLTLGSATYAFSGSFDDVGSSGVKILSRGNGMNSLVVTLQLDLFGGDQIRGQIKSGSEWTATLIADRQVFNKSSNQAPLAGAYTMAIPGSGDGASRPAGSSFGTVKVDLAGNVTWTGVLADGTKVSQQGALSKTGIWPLYVSSGGSVVVSWIQIGANLSTPNSGLAGDLVWFKPVSASAKYYPTGFTNGVSVIGAAYVPPVSGSYQLSLGGAGLASNLTYAVQLGDKSKVTTLSADKLSLKITGSSSTFSGNVVDPGTSKTITFQGVLLEGGTGAGYFLGASQSGRVLLGQP